MKRRINNLLLTILILFIPFIFAFKCQESDPISLINNTRKEHGLNELKTSKSLNNFAEYRIDNFTFSHDNFCQDAITFFGSKVIGHYMGEVFWIGTSFPRSEQECICALMDSQTHKTVILDSNFKYTIVP